jgi:hypothetical protein
MYSPMRVVSKQKKNTYQKLAAICIIPNENLGPILWFFKCLRRKIWQKFWRFLLKLMLVFCKKNYHNIGFWEKRQYFRRKLATMAENCDHNIDPCLLFFDFHSIYTLAGCDLRTPIPICKRSLCLKTMSPKSVYV